MAEQFRFVPNSAARKTFLERQENYNLLKQKKQEDAEREAAGRDLMERIQQEQAQEASQAAAKQRIKATLQGRESITEHHYKIGLPEPAPLVTRDELVPKPAVVGETRPTSYITGHQLREVEKALFDPSRFDANVLSTVDQPTYHFKLFMIRPTDIIADVNQKTSELAKEIMERQHVVLAETGVTGFNIREVQLECLVGPNFQTRNTDLTTLTITIVEPLGTSFFDLIKKSAEELGIQNHQKINYYLQLTFKGYDADAAQVPGAINTNVCSHFPNGGVWIWEFSIKDIQTSFDNGGGTYTITGVLANHQILNDLTLRLPESIHPTVVNAHECLRAVVDKLNASVRLHFANFQLFEYDFVFHPIVTEKKTYSTARDFQLVEEPEKNASQKHNFFEKDGSSGKLKAHFPRGMTLTEVIELTFRNTKLAQELVQTVNLRERAQGRLAANQKDKSFDQIFTLRIEPEVNLVPATDANNKNYTDDSGKPLYLTDPLTNTYPLKIKFHIFGYQTSLPILGREHIEESRERSVQEKMIKAMYAGNFLKKRYDYLFTGRNTEVLNFDFRYNFAWEAVLPRFIEGINSTDQLTNIGAKLNASSLDHGQYYQNTLRKLLDERKLLTDEYEDLKKYVAQNQQKPNETKPITIAGKEYKGGKDALTAADKRAQQTEQEIKIQNQKIGDVQAFVTESRNVLTAEAAANTRRATASTKREVFAEELRLAETPVSRPTFPIAVMPDMRDPRYQTSGSTTEVYESRSTQRSIFSAVLDQLYGPTVVQFINISLEIKGDPFWLGPSNLDRRLILNGKNEKTFDGLPNFVEGDNCFLLVVGFPNHLQDDGRPQIILNDTFNGIYAVRKLTHTFQNGAFRQTIDAVFMPLIDIAKGFGVELIPYPKNMGARSIEPGV